MSLCVKFWRLLSDRDRDRAAGSRHGNGKHDRSLTIDGNVPGDRRIVRVSGPPAQAAEINSANTTSAAVEKIEPAVTAFENTFFDVIRLPRKPHHHLRESPGSKRRVPSGHFDDRHQPRTEASTICLPWSCTNSATISSSNAQSTETLSSANRSMPPQGITDTRSWYDSSAGWAATPAEQFSEAVALYVLGAKGSSMAISDEALDLIAAIGRPDSDTTRTPITANTAMRRSSQDGTNLSHATLVAAVQTPQPTAEVGPERTSSQSAPTPVSAWVASQVRLVIWRIAQ